MWIIDLRSDTLTKPTPEMRKCMAEAPVGDDVFSEDPSVTALQEEAAALVGTEAALYCPSGCMTNQLAIAVQTQNGDEVILDADSHVFNYETTAASYLSRVQLHPIRSKKGLLSVEDISHAIREKAYYMPISRMLSIENTLNRGGGIVYDVAMIEKLTAYAHSEGLITHLDGARLWNACAATGASPKDFAQHFDTISICFSKGLGAPVGSAFCSTKENVEKARRFRKIWGGGMRQAGIIAAGALYALQNNRARIVEDNLNARRFAEMITSSKTRISIDLEKVQSNIVLLDLPDGVEVQSAIDGLAERGVRLSQGNQHALRAVTHLDVSRKDCENAANIIADYFA